MFGYNVMTIIQNITRKCKGDHWVGDEVSKPAARCNVQVSLSNMVG